jgi:hypothetical protein
MTGKIKSSGKNRHIAASYTGYLLQARPDLIAALGMYVNKDKFRLLFTNALGVAYMQPVEWDNPNSGPLLCAWISRLYTPSLDGTIKRDNSTDNPTFTVTVKAGDTEKSYGGCSISKVGGPFHRRTIVLMDSKRENVIKEQYIDVDRRFEEGPILDIIHADRTFPGVVRKESYNVVQSDGKDLIVEDDGVKRKKTRLVMPDTGGRLMDAETPLDALIAFYDLLEGEPLPPDANLLLFII